MHFRIFLNGTVMYRHLIRTTCAAVTLLTACTLYAADSTTRDAEKPVTVEPEKQDEADTNTQEVIVTATRTATRAREVGSSVTKITARELEERQTVPLTDALDMVPGVDVSRTGGPGMGTSVRIRGADPRHTLVMIDGVEIGDPSSIARNPNLDHILTDNIASIEVLRGPQSTLYGSDSMGGVINITTPKGRVGKAKVHTAIEGGTFDTVHGTMSINGGTQYIQFNAGFSRFKTNGISSASDKLDGNSEDDWYDSISFFSRVTITPTDIFDLDFSGRFIDTDNDYDNGAGPNQDDPHSEQHFRQGFGRAQARLRLFDERWEQKLAYSTSHYKRGFDDPYDGVGDWKYSDVFWGVLEKLEWQNNIRLHRTNTLVLGAETEKESYELDSDSESPYDARTTGLYAEDQIKLFDRWFTTIGIRRDRHSEYGAKTTWRVTSAFDVKETGTRIKGSFGTGFKAPSLYQIYAPAFWGAPVGNTDLLPETSRGWDLGLEQSILNSRIKFGATFFRNRFKDMIDFVTGQGYQNRAKPTWTRGVESFVQVRPLAETDLVFRLDYTFMRSFDEERDDKLYLRPKNKITVSINYRFLKGKANLNLNAVYRGSVDDQYWDATAFKNTRVRLDDYLIVNLAASYRFNQYFRIFGRVENLTDEEYENRKGYGTMPAAAYVGMGLDF